MNKKFDYYYEVKAVEDCSYKIPKALFTDKYYFSLSCEAKLLYGLLLDKMSSSIKNNWVDEYNRVYVYFKLTEVMQCMGCSHEKAGKLLAELDTVKGIGLIERKRQGMGRPDLIYVKNLDVESETTENVFKVSGLIHQETDTCEESEEDTRENPKIIQPNKIQQKKIEMIKVESNKKEKSEILSSVNQNTNILKIGNLNKQKSLVSSSDFRSSGIQSSYIHDSDFQNANKQLIQRQSSEKQMPNITQISDIKINNKKFNNFNYNINQSINPLKEQSEKEDKERLDTIEKYKEIICENIGYSVLCVDYKEDGVDGIVDLLLEVVCNSKKTIKISGNELPIEVVKSRFLKLNQFHIQYVLDCMRKNTTKIFNIKQYLLTALYNASMTMDHYYRAEVNHDMYG